MALELSGISLSNPSVLVFEWLCGGGLLLDESDTVHSRSLVSQGQQMLNAVCADLLRAGIHPVVPLDVRFQSTIDGQIIEIADANRLRSCIESLANEVDWVLMIAPESGGRLVASIEWLANYSFKLLNPHIEFTRLCCSKNELQAYFANNGIPVPEGCQANVMAEAANLLKTQNGFIVKPDDGAGGEGVTYTRRLDQAISFGAEFRIEEFVPGLPVSVSVICHDERIICLPALRQEFDRFPVGNFVRCVDDLDSTIKGRARQLAESVVDALPKTNGYFGIDMVIGDRDVVIEVNPRITMSYPILCSKVNFNMATLMLDVRQGV